MSLKYTHTHTTSLSNVDGMKYNSYLQTSTTILNNFWNKIPKIFGVAYPS